MEEHEKLKEEEEEDAKVMEVLEKGITRNLSIFFFLFSPQQKSNFVKAMLLGLPCPCLEPEKQGR